MKFQCIMGFLAAIHIPEHLLTCPTPDTWRGQHPAATSGSLGINGYEAALSCYLGILRASTARKLSDDPTVYKVARCPTLSLARCWGLIPSRRVLELTLPSAWVESLTITTPKIEFRGSAFKFSSCSYHQTSLPGKHCPDSFLFYHLMFFCCGFHECS